MRIYTVGHSNRSFEAFLAILRAYDIRLVADVRALPRSRYNPQFEQAALTEGLPGNGVEYRHFAGLGGRRHPRPDSVNTAWQNDQFRGYADHMQTPEFAAAVDELLVVAPRQPAAVMCAEAVPWRCHRNLLSDALTVKGVEVTEILDERASRPHKLIDFAVVRGQNLTYPSLQTRLDL